MHIEPKKVRTLPAKLPEVRVRLHRSVKKRLALVAIEEGTTLGQLALRYILAGLDARGPT